jgi:hypothetical protein
MHDFRLQSKGWILYTAIGIGQIAILATLWVDEFQQYSTSLEAISAASQK